MPQRPQWHAPLVLAVALGLLAFGITREAWPWMADDAFISARYAERLATGEGLTWTDGERVEGYSNLLWVLLTAALGALGLDWVTALRVLGLASTAGALIVLLARELAPPPLPAALCVAALAAQATVAVWAIGGLEAPLVMLLIAVVMLGLARGLAADADAARRPLLIAGVALALLAWTRPDGPLWCAVAAATVFAFGRHRSGGPNGRTALALVVLPALLAVCVQLGFRVVYYGDWLPNTGRAKLSPSADTVAVGVDYLASAATSLRALLLPACLGLALGFRSRRGWPVLFFAVSGIVVWALYLLRVGGDVFPKNRLVLPALAPATVLAAHGLAALCDMGRAGRAFAWLTALASIFVARFDAARPTDDVRQQLSTWEWQAAATGEWLGRAFEHERPLLAVDAAGAVPFFSKLPCLDMLGLCDRTIASTPPLDNPGFIAGHNRGNGPYVLSRRPDLVLFWVPPGNPQPRWPSGVQMEADAGFLADYRVVLFDTSPGGEANLRITARVRLDGRLGGERGDALVRVPGYWLGSYRQPRPFGVLLEPLRPDDPSDAERCRDVALGIAWWHAAAVVGVIDAVGATVGEVRRAGRHVVPQLAVPPGRWRLRADGLPPDVNLSLCEPSGRPLERAGDLFRVARAAVVDVACDVPESAPLPLRVREIVLEREDRR